MVASLACTPHLAVLKPPAAHYMSRKSPRKHPNQSRIQGVYVLSDAFTVPPFPKSWRPAVVVNAFVDEWEKYRLTGVRQGLAGVWALYVVIQKVRSMPIFFTKLMSCPFVIHQ